MTDEELCHFRQIKEALDSLWFFFKVVCCCCLLQFITIVVLCLRLRRGF